MSRVHPANLLLIFLLTLLGATYPQPFNTAVLLCAESYVDCNGYTGQGLQAVDPASLGGFSVDIWNEIQSRTSYSAATYLVTNDLLVWTRALRNSTFGPSIGISGVPQSALSTNPLTTSNSYYHTYLRAAVANGKIVTTIDAITRAFNRPDLWGQILFWIVLAIFGAHIMWLIETQRKGRDNDLFNRQYLPGVHDGVYWAGVTSGTIGYGDKVPKTRTGMCWTLVWIVFSFFFAFTASATLTSLVTIAQLTPPPSSIEDLRARNVSIVNHSPALPLVRGINANVFMYPNLITAVEALLNGTTSFLLHDQPSLLKQNTTNRNIQSNGPSFLELDFVFTFSPDVDADTVATINLAIFELQQDTRSPYQGIIDSHFNATAALQYTPRREEVLKPYLTLIICGSIIALYLLFVAIWALATRKKHNRDPNKNQDDKNEQEQS